MPANLTGDEEMQVIHNSWQHAGKTKSKEIHKCYKGKLFHSDYLQWLEKFTCVTCAIMKGVRDYRHSTHMKQKMLETSNRLKRKSRKESAATVSRVTVSEEEGQKAANDCFEDNFLRALPSTTAEGEEQGILHIDFAHTIAIGFQNEKYYLVIVVGDKDFLWSSPTTTILQPEILLQEFVDLTGIKIRR